MVSNTDSYFMSGEWGGCRAAQAFQVVRFRCRPWSLHHRAVVLDTCDTLEDAEFLCNYYRTVKKRPDVFIREIRTARVGN